MSTNTPILYSLYNMLYSHKDNRLVQSFPTRRSSDLQRMLFRCFELEVEPPVDLWSGKLADDDLFASRSSPHRRKTIDGRQAIPYVRYVWPREIMVRSFTRVIPVSAKLGEVIGWVVSLAVASKRPVGRGTLIFLGSPLGPALRASDPEARSWLQSVVSV